ncbi:transmembrane amino acid transporter protein-domain-containing protein [Lipomyces japonicus]|uniref:transmembrane amino acid transporter protein-domain-containing protein n=1 Tax=Lipomyces japonicus TaxID=56871 RepID=UPI0034CDC3BA
MSSQSAIIAQDLVGSNGRTVEYIEEEEEEDDIDYNFIHLRDHPGIEEVEGQNRPKRVHKGTAGLSSSIANLSNTILGAGILAMPFALHSNGVLLGLAVILVSGITAAMGLYLQYRCSRYVERGNASFFAIAQKTYPSLAVLFDTAIAIKCFGVGVSYLIIIGDLMPQVVADILSFEEEYYDSLFLSRRFWITVFMVFIIPFCFLRKLDSLKYTSVIALVAIGYLTILVVSHWFIGDTIADRGIVSVWPKNISSVLASLPIVIFGFTCHQNMFSIVNELRDSRPISAVFIILTSIGSAVFLYTLVGLAGYLSYGDNISGNIIGMYPSSFTSAFGRIAIVILVMFSFPLQCHPCRASLDHVYTHFFPSVYSSSELAAGKHPFIPTKRFAYLSGGIIVASYFVAMIVSSLETVLAFVGATGSTSISFILPGIFGYKLLGSPYHLPIEDYVNDETTDEDGVVLVTPEESDDEEAPIINGVQVPLRDEDGEGRIIKYTSLALFFWGLFVMVTCLSTNVYLLNHKT